MIGNEPMNQKDQLKQIELVRSIPLIKDYTNISPVLGGYSSDQKYLAEKNGLKILVRTFSSSSYDEKKSEFESLKTLFSLGIRCPSPIEFGLTKAKEIGYMLLSFIEGKDGAEELGRLSTSEQYTVGIEAGEELKKIHAYRAPKNVETWEKRKIEKFNRHLSNYRNIGFRIPNEDVVVQYIEENMHLFINRPNVFQHDDYHLRNLVIHERKFAGVIDFGRHDWGDPVHEFIKIGHFSSTISAPFSVGQVMGYHDGEKPNEHFWKLYSLYSAMSLISIPVWTAAVRPEQMPSMMTIVDRVLEDHEGFKSVVPRWFSRLDEK